MNGSWKLPEFHWSVIFEPSPDSVVETQKIAISAAESVTILEMMKAIDTLTCRYEVRYDEPLYVIEYNCDGQCHSFKKTYKGSGIDMKPVDNLVRFLEKKKRR